MSKYIILTLGSGNFEDGFPSITVELREIHKFLPILRSKGSLPPVPEMYELYINWKSLYDALNHTESKRGNTPKVHQDTGIDKQVSEADFHVFCDQLKVSLNKWLNSPSFSQIEKKIRANVSANEEVWIVVETDNQEVQKLPWHLWDFFTDYPKAEIAFSSRDSQATKPPQSSIKKVRILAIIGNSEGIDTEVDQKILSDRSDVKIKFLVEPERQEISEQLWKEGWDVLFFAGHSETSPNEKGKIYINQNDSLTIEHLKYSLQKAIANGLQLAIFNSCEGLGLAWELAELQIPQIIVMKEPIPDLVAQKFLTYFLESYTQDKSLYLAVREAREKLQPLEDKCLCASWLPIIYQNLAQIPLSWKQLRDKKITPEPFLLPKNSLLIPSLIINGLITLFIIMFRLYGGLQFLELPAFDHLMRMRSLVVDERVDERILLVIIDDEDVKYQNDQKMNIGDKSLSDEALEKLILKLNQYQPRVIGLDIMRQWPIDSKLSNLKEIMQQKNLIFTCTTKTVKAPPDIQSPSQLGLANTPVDIDQVIRRQYIGRSKKIDCPTSNSLSFKLANLYLQAENKTLTYDQENYQFISDNLIIKRLTPNTGGYRLPVNENPSDYSNAQGFQILLNYRISSEIAERISLKEILDGSSDQKLRSLVKDKIILIGSTDETYKDFHQTYFDKKTPGVIIHAHAISQILSAVLNDRAIIWSWNEQIEMLWITIWIFAGGFAFWYWQSLTQRIIIASLSGITIYGSCYLVLLTGGWIPLVPIWLGIAASGFAIILVENYHSNRLLLIYKDS